MNASVKILGRENLRKVLRQIVGNTNALLAQEVRRTTLACRKEAKDLCPRASGTLRQSIQSRFSNGGRLGEVYVGERYGQWVEGIWHKARWGRAPGKRPPLLPLLKWVLIRRIHEKVYGRKGATLSRAKSLAYAICKKIGEKGTKAHPFLVPAFLHYKILFEKACQRILRRAATEAKAWMGRAGG